MSGGRVVSVQVCERHGSPMTRVAEARISPGRGIDGDVHAGRDARQVLLVDLADLREVGLEPGDLREQITVDLSGLMDLAPGTAMRTGEAIVEVAGPCEPCHHIGDLLGVPDTEALRRSLEGRRGVFVRVVSVEGEGRIRVGDRIEVQAAAPAPRA